MIHQCHAHRCKRPVEPKLLMCAHHWYQVPNELRGQVYATYRKGQEADKRPSAEYIEAARAAIHYIFKLETSSNTPTVRGKLMNVQLLAKALRSAADVLDGEQAAPATTAAPAKGKGKNPAPAEKQYEFDLDGETETTDDLDLEEESGSGDEPEVTLKEIQTAAQKLATKKGGKEKLAKIFKKFGIKALKDLDSDDYTQAHELITA